MSKSSEESHEKDKKPKSRKVIEYLFQYGLFLSPVFWIGSLWLNWRYHHEEMQGMINFVYKFFSFNEKWYINQAISGNDYMFVSFGILLVGLLLTLSSIHWFVRMKRQYSDATWLVWPLNMIFRCGTARNKPVYDLNYAEYIKDSAYLEPLNTKPKEEEKDTKDNRVAELA